MEVARQGDKKLRGCQDACTCSISKVGITNEDKAIEEGGLHSSESALWRGVKRNKRCTEVVNKSGCDDILFFDSGKHCGSTSKSSALFKFGWRVMEQKNVGETTILMKSIE